MQIADVGAWIIVVQLVTGQKVALDIPSEAACHEALGKIANGTYLGITIDAVPGLQLPVARGIGCIRKEDLGLPGMPVS